MILTIEKSKFETIPDLIEKQQAILDILKSCRKKQIKRSKKNEAGTRKSTLYLGIFNEIKNFLLQAINLVKAQKVLRGHSSFDINKDYSTFDLHANQREGQSFEEAKYI